MTEFHSGQAAAVVHANLKSALLTMEKAKQNAILWFGEILDRQLFRDLGYSSIQQYAEQELDWGKSKTYDFLIICQQLEKLPKVKAKVASGELGYTHAREMLKVTDPTNEDLWLDVALNNTRRELVREVKRARNEADDQKAGQHSLMPEIQPRPAAVVPARVAVEMSPTQLARYEALWVQLRKSTSISGDRAEALLEMMAGYLQENSTRVENPASPPVTGLSQGDRSEQPGGAGVGCCRGGENPVRCPAQQAWSAQQNHDSTQDQEGGSGQGPPPMSAARLCTFRLSGSASQGAPITGRNQ